MFDEGERIRIKEGLKPKDADSKCPGITHKMAKHRGKITKIIRKSKSIKTDYYYKLKIDNQAFIWTDEMLVKTSRIRID